MKFAALSVLLGGSLALAALTALPAAAQQGSLPQTGAPGTIVQQGDPNQQFPPDGKDGQVDHIDRVAGATPRGGIRSAEGVKLVAPGALLFASFDKNFDGKVSREEIDAAAPGAFAAADRNHDGKVSGFEQNDWAASVGSPSDVLANPMTFDKDLDHMVTPAEFAGGLRRIAEQLMGVGGTEMTFAELVKPLSRQGEQAERGPVPIGPRVNGPNVSPSVLGR